MTGRPEILRFLPVWGALACVLSGCHLPSSEPQPQPAVTEPRSIYSAGPLTPDHPRGALSGAPWDNSEAIAKALSPPMVEMVRGPAPALAAPVVVVEVPQRQADALTAQLPMPEVQLVSATTGLAAIPAAIANAPKPSTTVLIREDNNFRTVASSTAQPGVLPAIPIPSLNSPTTTMEPPIRGSAPTVQVDTTTTAAADTVPGVPLPPGVTGSSQPITPINPPAVPSTNGSTAGPIVIGGRPTTFDALAKMVDATGGGPTEIGCSSCGECGAGRPCAPGAHKCEPFPDDNPFMRMIGMVYQTACCPDPCYEGKWEPIQDSAFFVDTARPVSQTKFVWDYYNHFAFPDRAEYLWAAPTSAGGRGPSAVDGLKAVPYINLNQLTLVTEIATPNGQSSVAIAMPYRSWDAEPFAHSDAGFSDMSITAKTLLVDSELFLCAMQFRTYIPIGNVTTGLGDGHVSLEPGMIFGLRCSPTTYIQAEVQEWVPLGGDPNAQGAFLQWGLSVNQMLWQPVKDVKFIGTLELSGYSFQAGQYTDPVLGPQKLSGENNLQIGNGYRMFFCDRFDVGLAGNFGVTGKYMAREAMQFDLRFRY